MVLLYWAEWVGRDVAEYAGECGGRVPVLTHCSSGHGVGCEGRWTAASSDKMTVICVWTAVGGHPSLAKQEGTFGPKLQWNEKEVCRRFDSRVTDLAMVRQKGCVGSRMLEGVRRWVGA